MQTDSTFSKENSNADADSSKVTAAAVRSEIGDWSDWLKSNKLGAARPLRKILSKNCLFWGMPTSDVIYQPVIARLIQLKIKPTQDDASFEYLDAAKQWRETVKDPLGKPLSVATLMQALAWAHALPALATRLSEDDWSELLAALLRLSDGPQPSSAIACIVTGVELPLALAYCLPTVSLCRTKRKPARQRFHDLLDELLDGEGMPQAVHLSGIQYLLASCTRTLAMDAESKKSHISKDARLQFDWLTRQTLRWTRPDGACILQEAHDSPHFDEMLKHALQFTDDETDLAAFKLLRGKRVLKAEAENLPSTSEHSEWAEVVTMRSRWDAKAIRLAATYHDRSFSIEVGAGSETIFSGKSEPRVVVDGKLLNQDSEWADVCWESDRDLDYLELECMLTGGWQVQMPLLLARQDQFVILADAIIGPRQAEIQYQHTLPIVESVCLEQTNETTEVVMLGKGKFGHVIPLALPEWKSAQGNDRLRTEPARLELSARSNALYAPLFFSLDPNLRNKPLTWRQLTVAEDLLTVSKDVAVAYRVQIGKSQWVIYRSLATPGNRTFLGLNLISDFYVARFQADGETQMLIDVEPS